MPCVVKVKGNPGHQSNQAFLEVSQALPHIVAETLNVDGFERVKWLSSSDVKVIMETVGPVNIDTFHFDIIVLADDFPERRANLQERAGMIQSEVYDLLRRKYNQDFSGRLLVLLRPTMFGEF